MRLLVLGAHGDAQTCWRWAPFVPFFVFIVLVAQRQIACSHTACISAVDQWPCDRSPVLASKRIVKITHVCSLPDGDSIL